jgi:hypothetical protein
LPAPHRRFDQVRAPGYQGRKRGEVVRTRTIILQAHTHQFLSTFGGPGNGDYRGDLRRAVQVITSYATQMGRIWHTFGDARSSSSIERSFYMNKNTFVEGSGEDESEASACSPGGIRSNRY